MGIWFPGIGYMTYTTMPSSQSTVNRNTPTIVKTLRASVRVMSDGKNVAASGRFRLLQMLCYELGHLKHVHC